MKKLDILDKIHARLEKLTEANGYAFTLNSIKRARLKPFENGDLPALNYWPGQDTILEKSYGKEKHKIELSMQAYTVVRDTPFTDTAYVFGDAIITALNRDVLKPLVTDEPSYNLGGLILDLTVPTVMPVITEGQNPWCGVLLSIEIIFFTGLANADFTE